MGNALGRYPLPQLPGRGLVWWLQGDSGFTVSSWKAIVGYNATQANPSNQGVATTLNGRAAVSFPASAYMSSATGGPVTGNAPHTLFVAAQFTLLGAQFMGLVGWGGGNVGISSSAIGVNPTSSNDWWYGGSNLTSADGTVADTNPHVLSKTFDGTSIKGYLDGNLNATLGSATFVMLNGMVVGGYDLVGHGAAVNAKIIGEVLVYNRVLSATELLQVNLFLKARWGTP